MKFFCQNILRPTFFWTNIFLTNFFYNNYFENDFLTKFFSPNSSFSPNCFFFNIFTPILPETNNFLDSIFSQPKFFSNFFFDQIFFDCNFFYNICLTNFFFTNLFFSIFFCQNFLGPLFMTLLALKNIDPTFFLASTRIKSSSVYYFLFPLESFLPQR